MILIDANLLLYAYDSSSEQHQRAKEWLESVFTGPGPVYLSWMTIMAFLRIGTNPRALTNPLSTTEAITIIVSIRQRGVTQAPKYESALRMPLMCLESRPNE